jgi:MFS family permease
MALRALTGLGSSVWLPTFFIRTYGWSTAEVGLALGSIMLICSPAGLVTGGIIAEKLVNRGYDDANMRVALISTIISVPLSVLFPLMPGPYLALAVYAVNNFLVSLSPGPQNAALQTVTPNQIRAQATAMYLFLFNLIGFGLGPLVIAAFTDYLFHSEAAIGYSISLNFAIFGPVACLVFWYGLKPYRDSVRRARARINAA